MSTTAACITGAPEFVAQSHKVVQANSRANRVCGSEPRGQASCSYASLHGRLLDELHQAAQVGRVGLRQDAVAEVEDVTGAPGGAAQDVPSPLLDPLPRAEQQGRVEVALDAPIFTDLGP